MNPAPPAPVNRRPRCATIRSALTAAASVALAATLLGGCQSRTAVSDFERVRAEEANAARTALEHVREAERLEKAKKFDQAIDEYTRAVRLYRELPAAWNNLGRLLMEKGQNNAAAEAFRIAADLTPADPKPVYNLGALWESMGWPEDAARYYSEALSRDQNHLPSLRRSILLDVNLGRATDQTEIRLRRALLLESDQEWRAHLMRAQVRMRDGSLTIGKQAP